VTRASVCSGAAARSTAGASSDFVTDFFRLAIAAFADFFALREIIASRSDVFAKGFSTALIEYGLGRSIGFRDEPLIEDMVTAAKKDKLGVRAFVKALVSSREFHTK
jgi:hypothetical protein